MKHSHSPHSHSQPPHLRGLTGGLSSSVDDATPAEDSKEVQKRKRTGKYTPHPDDMKILNRITDEKEYIKVRLNTRIQQYVHHNLEPSG